MNSQDKMTMAQAQEKMACLKEVFTIVRLLDGQQLLDRAAGKTCRGNIRYVSMLFFLGKGFIL